MKNDDRIEYLKQLLSKGLFPNEKNRIWTMCQASLQMLIMTVEEAEKAKMTDEQFYINFEDAINELSIKDHHSNELEFRLDDELKESIKSFIADSGLNS